MVRAIRVTQPERASGRLAYHVLDVMFATDRRQTGTSATVASVVETAPLLPAGRSLTAAPGADDGSSAG